MVFGVLPCPAGRPVGVEGVEEVEQLDDTALDRTGVDEDEPPLELVGPVLRRQDLVADGDARQGQLQELRRDRPCPDGRLALPRHSWSRAGTSGPRPSRGRVRLESGFPRTGRKIIH